MTKIVVEGDDIMQIRFAVRERTPSPFIRIDLRRDERDFGRFRAEPLEGAVVHVESARVPIECLTNQEVADWVKEQLDKARREYLEFQAQQKGEA